MANKYLDTAFVDKAIKFAVDAHANTERRGKGFPYVIHVLEAMEIVATITSDPELLAAAALHDTVEDTDVTVEQIRAEFGDRVASIVASESDSFEAGISETDSWRGRKQAAIDRLRKAPRDAKIVALGDKLSNMRAISRDYNIQGDKLWDLFHAPNGRDDHEWHYRGLAASLSDLAGTAAYAEFCKEIQSVFGRPKPELIDMDDYVESGDGFTAISYNHKDGDRMMKLYSEFVPTTEPYRELKVSWSLADMGIVSPKALRLVTDGKRVGLEFERLVNKRSFARAISQEPEKLEEYTRKFARMCKKLHSTPCDTTVFPPAENRFLQSINNGKSFSDAQKARMIDFVMSVPRTNTCVHGDLHIGNALMVDDKEYWIDLSDFAYGNPLFDLGMFHFVCWGCNQPEIVMRLYHITVEQIHQVWEVFVDEYFGPDCDHKEIWDRVAPFSALYMAHFDTRDALLPGMMEFIVEQFGLDKI